MQFLHRLSSLRAFSLSSRTSLVARRFFCAQHAVPEAKTTRSLLPQGPYVLVQRGFFYPIGNTPPRFLTESCPRSEPNVSLLLLGCGDLRHVLFTSWMEHKDNAFRESRKSLDFTLCDSEAGVLARNLLFLAYMQQHKAQLADPAEAEPCLRSLWRLMYDQRIDADSQAVLHSTLDHVLASASSMDSWHSSALGRSLRFSSERSFHDVRKLWMRYQEGITDYAAQEWMEARRQEIDHMIAGQDVITAMGNAGVAKLTMMEESTRFASMFREYSSTGVTFPHSEDEKLQPNPTVVYTQAGGDGHASQVFYGTDPMLAFHLAPILLPLPNATTPSSNVGYYNAAFGQFSEQVVTMSSLLAHNRVRVRVFSGDALELCTMLEQPPSVQFEDSAGRLGTVQLCSDYAQKAAPTRFDVIDTSNICDLIGKLVLSMAAGPLLRRVPHAELRIELLTSVNDFSFVDFLSTVCLKFDPSLRALMLGLSEMTLLTGFNTQNYRLEQAIRRASDEFKMRSRLFYRWRPHALVDPLSARVPTTRASLRIPPDELERLFATVVQTHCDLEPLVLSRSSKTGDLDFPRHSPASLVSMAHALAARTGNPSGVGEALEEAYFNNVACAMSGVNQEMLLWQYLLGLRGETPSISHPLLGTSSAGASQAGRDPHTVVDAAPAGMSSSDADNADEFFEAGSPPEAVKVSILIPADRYRLLKSDQSAGIHMLLKASGTHGFDHVFQSVHCVPLLPASQHPRDGPTTMFNGIEYVEAGVAEECSVLLVSALVPAWARQLQSELTVGVLARVSSALDQGPGKSLFMASADDPTYCRLVDVPEARLAVQSRNKHWERPSGAPLFLNASPTAPMCEPDDEVQATGITAQLDDKGLPLLSTNLTFRGGNYAQMFQQCKGGQLRIRHDSPCTLTVLMAGGRHQCSRTVLFPVPVDASSARVKLDRSTASLLLRVAPLTGDRWRNPFPMMRSTVDGKLNLHCWSIPRVVLDACPEFVPNECNEEMNSMASCVKIGYEKTLIGSKKIRTLELRDALNQMLMHVSGLNNLSSMKWFAVKCSDLNEKYVQTLVFVNAVRLDLSGDSIVLDASVCTVKKRNYEALTEHLSSLPLIELDLPKADFEIWQRYLVACVERCRTDWQHSDTCPFHTSPTVPLSVLHGEAPYCECGQGQNLPPAFVKPNRGLAPIFVRAAIAMVMPCDTEF